MQPENVQSLLELPLETVATLASGYLGYRVAYTGKDTKHGPLDVIFITLAFSFISKSLLALTLPAEPDFWRAIGGYSLAVSSSLVAAGVWRRWISDFAFSLLRGAGVSSADRCTTAWESMLHRSRSPQRLVVRKKNGDRLMTSNLADFNESPLGTCLLGEDGSVGMYVTDIMLNGEHDWEEREVFDKDKPDWGYDMTFVPASEIAEVRVSLHDTKSLRNAKRYQKPQGDK